MIAGDRKQTAILLRRRLPHELARLVIRIPMMPQHLQRGVTILKLLPILLRNLLERATLRLQIHRIRRMIAGSEHQIEGRLPRHEVLRHVGKERLAGHPPFIGVPPVLHARPQMGVLESLLPRKIIHPLPTTIARVVKVRLIAQLFHLLRNGRAIRTLSRTGTLIGDDPRVRHPADHRGHRGHRAA